MAKNDFTENTRVQVPAPIHFCLQGYTYLSAFKDEYYETMCRNSFLRKYLFV